MATFENAFCIVMTRLTLLLKALLCLLPCGIGWSASPSSTTPVEAPAGWLHAAPRDEVRPEFAYQASMGRSGKGVFIIQHDAREGLDGYWTKTFPIEGGQFYRFEAYRRSEDVTSPRRSAVVRLLWQDEKGKRVLRDAAASASSRYVTNVLHGFTPSVEAEHPLDKSTDAAGWTEVSDVYRAPAAATRAVIELHLHWAPRG